MIEFGKTLKAAREAKGLTVGQLAETTRMMSSIVEELENEDFSHIVAPIYGRGFVKLYCETVGLDPKPLVDEFMALYSGRRDDKKVDAMTTPPPVETSRTEPADDEPSVPFPFSGRLVLLALAALLVLAILFVGLRALYRATATPRTDTPTEVQAAEQPAKPAAQTSKPAAQQPVKARTPQDIPPLYID